MHPTINLTSNKNLIELNVFELYEIEGGGFWGDLAYRIGYAAHLTVTYFKTLKEELGTSEGYPPR
jgi:hypothetical protein